MNRDGTNDAGLDERLERWLMEGPPPPDALLARTVDATASARQRSSLRLPSFAARTVPYAATVAAATVVAVTVVTLIAPRDVTPPAGEPTATASPTPGWDDRFPVIYAGDFPGHPFTYAIDPASGLILTSWPDPFQFRVPRGPATDNFDEGVIVHTVAGGLRSRVCRASGGAVDPNPTTEDVMRAIQALDGLEVSPIIDTTIDGRPALAATVSGSRNRTCDAYYLFDGYEPAFAFDGNEGRTRRVFALDVDGDIVIIEITASDERYEAFVPTAEAFIASIHFDPP